ncbi:MAG: GTPase Era [Bacteroidota bacterium]
MDELTAGAEGFRAGYVALVGAPNVGKSTLLNFILGQKLSIVSPKPQTTRHKILGILSTEQMQVIFLDTPGIIDPRYALHRAMMDQSASALSDADIVLFMADLSEPKFNIHRNAFDKVRTLRKPVYLVLNKCDCVQNAVIEERRTAYMQSGSFKRTFAISALKGSGVPDLVTALAGDLPRHPPYYPMDVVSDRQQRFFVAEIIREKIFMLTRDEIPYSTSVDVVEFKEREAGKWFVSADIIVERASQKGIVIGKGGALLKEIGQQARGDIEKFLEYPIYLDLHVKVREKWREKEEWVRRFGYHKD